MNSLQDMKIPRSKTLLVGFIIYMYGFTYTINNNNNIYLKSNIQCTYRYEFSGLYNNNIAITIINSDYNLNNNNISTIFTHHPYC